MRFANLILILVLTGPAGAEGLSPSQQATLDESLRSLLIQLGNDPEFAAQASEGWAVGWKRNEEVVASFGAVVEPADDGLSILAVTPDSVADRLQLRSEDRIQALNGNPVSGTSGLTRLRELLTQLSDGDAVELEVRRGDQILRLAGTMTRLVLPQANLWIGPPPADPEDRRDPPDTPCGTVSTYRDPPHQFNLYGVSLNGINTDSAPRMRDFQYLVPGEYTIRVWDHIPARELRMQHTRFTDRRDPKTLTLQVEDGMVYHLGARLLYERKEQKGQDEYWSPVVWKMEPGYCTGKPVQR